MRRFVWIVIVMLSPVVLLSCGGAIKTSEVTQTAPEMASSTPTPPSSKVSPPVVKTLTPTATQPAATPTATQPLVTPTSAPPTPVTSSPTPTLVPSPTPTLPPDTPILPLGDPGAATNLQAEVECSVEEPRKGIAKLSWTVATSPGSAQRVDVTIFRGGFERGEFETTGPLPPSQSSLVWDRLSGQAIHFWRVLTLHADGWVPSETSSFEGPTCAADFVPAPTTPVP